MQKSMSLKYEPAPATIPAERRAVVGRHRTAGGGARHVDVDRPQLLREDNVPPQDHVAVLCGRETGEPLVNPS